MKKIYLLVISLFVCVLGFAQASSYDLPEWVLNKPTPSNKTFSYVVGKGVGLTEADAETKAIADVYYEARRSIGMDVTMDEVQEAYKTGSTFGRNMNMHVPIRKACSYTTTNEKNEYVVYVLCQVSEVGRTQEANFDNFTDCYKAAKNQYLKYAFVPGMAQIKKGSVAKGACFITGEVVFIGGIVVSECMRANYVQKMNMTHNTAAKQQYLQYANTCAIVRNVSIAGAVAVYIWNVIDGIVAKPKNQINLGQAKLNFMPYADTESMGLAVNLNF